MKAQLRRIDGYVWCERTGEIHADSLDPYNYGAPDEGEEDARCKRADHRAVYARQEIPF